jgi:hypothetical protein
MHGAGSGGTDAPLWRRIAVYTFVTINLLAALSFNRPPNVRSAWTAFAADHWDRRSVRALDWSGWVLGWYGYLAGLEQTYWMFSTLHRSQAWYRIVGVRADDTEYVFPIEGQTDRTFWERNFVDHKRGKFHLNMYGNPTARQSYSRYLCRRYADAAPGRFDRVRFEWNFREFLPREQALERGTHWAGDPYVWKNEFFECPR